MEKSRQHFVQKKILSNFSNSPDRPYDKQTIWVHDKSSNDSFISNIKNIAVKKKFLEKNADDVLTAIESECYPALARIIDQKCILCKKFGPREALENHIFLYRYVGHQLYRTPAYRRRIMNLPYWRGKNQEDLIKYQSNLFNKAKYVLIDFDLEGKNRAIPDEKRNMSKIYYETLVKLTKLKLNQSDDLAASLFNVIQPIILVNKSNIPFYTNDVGLAWFFPFYKTINLIADGYKIESWLVFPISPKVAIFLCTTKSTSIWANSIEDDNRGMILDFQDEKTINLVNKNIKELSERYVFSTIKIDSN
ncbi:MAG: hypothetical protein HeimC3_47500 [Candidatus Heimdallarchaeota archaeon LC_3]|nr:MAG: hypothetical protein HeimC3_47500 [Candidatus Heimdallarchaeota archaeon LC_3]